MFLIKLTKEFKKNIYNGHCKDIDGKCFSVSHTIVAEESQFYCELCGKKIKKKCWILFNDKAKEAEICRWIFCSKKCYLLYKLRQ